MTICETGVAEASVCTNPSLVGPGRAVVFNDYLGNGNLTAEGMNNSALYAQWDPTVNVAHAPLDVNGNALSIGTLNGMVSWEVGTGPFDGGIEPGFYQVTIMVEERIEAEAWDAMDPDLAFRNDYTTTNSDYYGGYDLATGLDRLGRAATFSTLPTRRNAGPKVPVDFMMYLYPAMHYCSSNCDRSSSGNVMQTFESSDGLYGDPTATPRPGDGLSGTGTGTCKICGGGGTYTSVPGDSGMVYTNVTKDSLSYCSVINAATSSAVQNLYSRGYENEAGVAEYGLWRSTLQSERAWKDYSDKCAM